MRKWKNFALLWQGQLISILGDTVYASVISYLVLEQTGSTAKMSVVTSVGLLARVITGIVSGAVVDNVNRKYLMVFLDAVRGITVLLTVIGIVKYNNGLLVWLVLSQIIVDICAAFFNPSINSVIPDIVDASHVVQANSNMTVSRFLGKILGNLIFASFFNIAFYPVFLVINGCSYLFSSFTEIFIKVPDRANRCNIRKFSQSIKKGYCYVGKKKGLRNFLFLCGIMNIFLCMTEILYIPFFDKNDFGINMYGYCMGALSLGTISAAVLMSLIKLKMNSKNIMMISCMGYFFLAAIFPVQKNAYFLAAVFFLMGCTDAVIHNIISACLQLNTDAEFRGVVFSLYSLTNNVMKPISISIGGILGEYFDIGKLIMVIMIAGIIALGFCFRNKALLDFMTLYKKGMER